jgi:phosphate transport system permease protein
METQMNTLGKDRPVLHPFEDREESNKLDRGLRLLGLAGALFPAGALLFIAVVLLVYAVPSIFFNGFGFLYNQNWNFGDFYTTHTIVRNGVQAPVGASYGALAILIGTLLTSIIAFVSGVPVAVGAALILVEKVPPGLKKTFSLFLELLAGIPSVVYGLWGLIVLGPFLARHVYPILARLGGFIHWLAAPVGSGLGLLTAGIVLAVMIIPIVAATTRDLLEQVPVLSREGALALGLTSWESARWVSLPWVARGILGAAMLGWARALGETMAVLIVSGNGANFLPSNIYSPISTIASSIVALLDSAQSDPTGMAVSALAEAGFLLMLITLTSNLLARLLVRRNASINLPIGRGI